MTFNTTLFEARRVVTMNPSRPFATHVAVRDGRIIQVGMAEDFAGSEATLDRRFASKVMLPGFVEGHAHVMEGTLWQQTYVGAGDRRSPDGRHVPGLRTTEAVIARLAEASRKIVDPDGLLYGWGFDPLHLRGQRLTRHDLDRVSTTRPVMVHHASLHITVVNSLLLKMAGFDASTSIQGVPKLADGTPSGELQGIAARLRVFRGLGYMPAPEDEGALMSEFCRNAGNWLANSEAPAFRLLVRETDPKRGPCSRFVAHVPPEQLSAFEPWTRKWFTQNRDLQIAEDALEFDQLAPSKIHSRADRIRFHWKCVRDLYASLDPGVQDRVERQETPKPLVALLAIPKAMRRTPTAIPDRAFSASSALSQTTIEKQAEVTGMPYLSAYDDGAYDRLDEGWELEEYNHRQSFSNDRAEQLRQINAALPDGDLATQRDREVALKDLDHAFPSEARARPGRNWLIWPPRNR